MTKAKLKYGNKLIAIFMGYKWSSRSTLNGIKGVLIKPGFAALHLNFKEAFHASYHSSWSSFMPAWIKFRDLNFDDVRNQLEHSDYKQSISQAISFKGDSPEFAFIKLTEAIEWYNTYTQNNQP